MQKEKFSIMIHAPREKVWQVLWGKSTYPVWTEPFGAGSRVETDWQEGGRVLFLSGENDGMIARIAKKNDNEFMSFEHLGMIDKDGNEDFDSEKVKPWAGSREDYRLTENDGKTELEVELDVDDSYKDFFQDSFPRALQRIKELSQDKFVS